MLTESDVRAIVESMLTTRTQRDLAYELGVSVGYLNDYLHFRREPGPKLLEGLGIYKVTLYEHYKTLRRVERRAHGGTMNPDWNELETCMKSLREHMDLLKQTSISAEYFRLVAERKERIAAEQTDYAISLQRAIEAHCRDEVAETTEYRHHAEALNACLARHNTS